MGHKPNIIERVMGLQYSVANEQWKDFKINYLLATLPDPLNNTCHQSTTSGVPHDSQFSKQILVVPLCDGEAAGRSALGRERQVEEMLAFAGALYGAAGACPTTSSARSGTGLDEFELHASFTRIESIARIASFQYSVVRMSLGLTLLAVICQYSTSSTFFKRDDQQKLGAKKGRNHQPTTSTSRAKLHELTPSRSHDR
jgi:hypothetical protein